MTENVIAGVMQAYVGLFALAALGLLNAWRLRNR
jgi:hypothetical protein